MILRRAPTLGTWLLITVFAPAARASAPDLLGFGARGTAMAGTVTATAVGHEAVYYNPAALGFEERRSFSLGFQLATFSLDLNGEPAGLEAAPAAIIGVGVPIPFRGILARRVGLGIGLVLPYTAVLDAEIPRPGEPRFVRIDPRAHTVSVMAALGVRVFDALAIGVGTIVLAELSGAIDVAPNASGRIGARVEDQLTAAYAFTAGALFRPAERWWLGAVFRDRSTADFDIPVTADLGEEFPLPIPALDISGTAQFDPRQIGLAAAFAPAEGILVAAGAVYQLWSEFENPVVYTAVPDGFPSQPEPGFSNVLGLRAGAELRLELSGLEVMPRFGLGYEPTPVPEQSGFHDYLDNVRWLLAAGAGVRAGGVFGGLAGQVHLLPARTSEKAPPERPGSVRHGGAIFAMVAEIGVEM